MPYEIDTPISIHHNEVTTHYLCSSKHRGAPTYDISVWLVDMNSEVNCFLRCLQAGWHDENNGWGLIPDGIKALLRLGHNLRNEKLLIAKFVTCQNMWHGYPADIRNKPNDKPIPRILASWWQEGFISKAMMSRIKQGQL